MVYDISCVLCLIWLPLCSIVWMGILWKTLLLLASYCFFGPIFLTNCAAVHHHPEPTHFFFFVCCFFSPFSSSRLSHFLFVSCIEDNVIIYTWGRATPAESVDCAFSFLELCLFLFRCSSSSHWVWRRPADIMNNSMTPFSSSSSSSYLCPSPAKRWWPNRLMWMWFH